MPAQRPGRSKQDYGTPSDLLAAVEQRFGDITVDLAASRENAVVSSFFDEREDALAQDWTALRGVLWLNPPFAKIAPWAAKCVASVGRDRTIVMLTPASVGAGWFAAHVHGSALVLALSPRLTFVGCDAPYPKDCMLSVYGAHAPGFDVWRWKS